MVDACRVLHDAKLDNNSWGFVAIRDALGRGVWITKDSMGFGEIAADDVALVSHSGVAVSGCDEPDQECTMALAVMFERPTITAVVHAHSIYATAFSTTRGELRALSHEGCHLVPPDVARARTPTTSTEASELAVAIDRNAVLLSGHGLLTVGESIGDAVALAIYLEKTCRLHFMVGSGGHRVIDDEVFEKRAGQVARPRTSWEYLRRVSGGGAGGA